jgi:HD-GYP domain-containing protein (c-di-GMP phosphodiesterase class II)
MPAISAAPDTSTVLTLLLHAAFSLGAPRPRAGLWRDEDKAYAMSALDSDGKMVACGSAPASLYGTTGDGIILLASSERRWGLLDVSGQISSREALTALAVVSSHAVLRLESLDGRGAGADQPSLLDALERWDNAETEEALIRGALVDVAAATGAESASLTLVDQSPDRLITVFAEDAAAQAPDDPLPWLVPDNKRRNVEAIRRVLQTGASLAFRWNPTTEALKAGLLPGGPEDGSYLAFPIREGQNVIGVLDAWSPQIRRFGTAQDALMERAARVMGRLLSLMRSNQRHRLELERNELLVHVAGLLAAESDLRGIANGITAKARELFRNADVAYVLLPQAEGGLWSVASIEADNAEDCRHGWARAGEGFAGWVIQSRQTLVVSQGEEDPRRGSLDRGQNVRSGVWAPMMRGNDLLGVLAICGVTPDREFTPDDVEILESLAEQGAVALERARERHATQAAFWDAIEALGWAIDARDGYTHGHSRNVTEYSVAIAARMGQSAGEIQTLRASALLHDIGKIGIPDHILNKPGQLTPDERKVMESHPEVGYQILLRAPSLQALLPGVRYHHERFDGKGYPCGLSGDSLPAQARILAVADAFDAMTSDRVYRKRMTIDKAANVLKEGAGTQWDPETVEIFLGVIEERGTPRLQMLAAEDSGRAYLPSLGTDVFGV